MSFGADFVEKDRWIGVEDLLLLEEVFAYSFSKNKEDDKMLEAMLASQPVALNFNQTKTMWNRMKPLNIEMMFYYWDRTNETAFMLPWGQLEYAEWSEVDGNISTSEYDIVRNYGCRNKDSGKKAGIVR